jgi:hypothetical protein
MTKAQDGGAGLELFCPVRTMVCASVNEENCGERRFRLGRHSQLVGGTHQKYVQESWESDIDLRLHFRFDSAEM